MTDEELKENCYFSNVPFEISKAIAAEYETYTHYIGWLEKHGEDVVLRVWAYRDTKTYGHEEQEVMRALLGSDGLYFRNMYYTGTSGYKVVYRKGKGVSRNWYGYTYYAFDEADWDKWVWTNKVGVAYSIINMDMLKNTKFKYSGYNGKGDFLGWMRTFTEYPQVELLGKLGYGPSKKLLKKCANDKSFARFLAKNELKDTSINAIVYAYDHKISVEKAGAILLDRADAGKYFKGCGTVRSLGIDLIKARDYMRTQKNGKYWGSGSSYNDYLMACVNLGLDMTDTKNLYPKDFWRMHDLRTNQWKSKKNKAKAEEFKKAAEQYLKYELSDNDYVVIIPLKLTDLTNEGNKLHHCVGRMGYDQKMIDGKSFIAFVRKADNTKKPFVTVEYSMEKKTVLQAYGDHDSKPDTDVLKFINKWSKLVKKAI